MALTVNRAICYHAENIFLNITVNFTGSNATSFPHFDTICKCVNIIKCETTKVDEQLKKTFWALK